jgi:hypothetical protein
MIAADRLMIVDDRPANRERRNMLYDTVITNGRWFDGTGASSCG